MKAFKEWKRNATVDISNCKNGGDLMEVVMEETWKAALEWVNGEATNGWFYTDKSKRELNNEEG